MIKTDQMREPIVLLALFFIFILIRLLAWSQTVVLEDHDSVSYLIKAQAFSELDFDVIWGGYPDFIPAYSLATGLLSLIFGDIEFSARLCSLLFSTLLFYSTYKLARLYFNKIVSSVALLLMATNPILTQLSFSVLTEPMYISICVTGLYLFLKQVESASLKKAVLLGILFGVSFLTRAEGIMFLLVIPFFQLLHYFLAKTREYTRSGLINWSVVYMLVFCITILPQIIAVSVKIGEPALNGRQVWSEILKSNPDQTYGEKIYGIDYDPGKINLKYLQENPDKIDNNYGAAGFNVTLSHMFNEAKKFRYGLTKLLHWPQLLFLPFGLIAIFAQRSNFRKLYFSITLTGFASACMVPPLWHDVALRHVAIITPILIIFAALGVAQLADLTKKISPMGFFDRKAWGIIFALLLVVAQTKEIRSVLEKQKVQQGEYNHEEMLEIASVIRSHIGDADPTSFVIASRKNYIKYFTGMKGPYVPYADWNRSKRYWKLNGVDFVLLREHLLKEYPIFQNDDYLNSDDRDFKLIWTKKRDAYGKSIFLYKAIRSGPQ